MVPTFKAWLRSALREFLGDVPPKPRAVTIKGTEVVSVLRYHFSLPPAPAGIDDFDHREATVTVDGVARDTVTVAKDATEFTADFDRNVAVSVSLRDVDTSGNKSDPSDPLTFTATDTVPPPKPGELSVSKVEQIG